jgi:hypothetical protein
LPASHPGRLLAARISPQLLVQLQLQAYRQAVIEYPPASSVVLLSVAGREQDFTGRIQLVVADDFARPLVIPRSQMTNLT